MWYVKFEAISWKFDISDGLYTVSGMIITIPSLVLFCDHLMAHIIKYKDMVKVEKISPQQAKSHDICENVKFGAISWKFDILSITA